MVRKLKHHESRLLKKVSLHSYPQSSTHAAPHANATIRRYSLQHPQDYDKYNRLSGSLRKLAHQLAALDPADPVRLRLEREVLSKLYGMGLVKMGGGGRDESTNGADGKGNMGAGEAADEGMGRLSQVEKLSVAAFCRRRLAVVMTRLKMAESVTGAVKFVEQGHVRVGTDVVTDPAFLVTRNMEDFVTWVDSSKVKRNILQYRDKLDDFDLL
ncbi:MAG: Small subunit (SSU) processome component [Vezdaea aestivalis]|nr:MAG: Small subunit (SSU) processome component [Vezdaea aestivalis]